MAEPDPVQQVACPARPDKPGRALPCRYGAVKAPVLLEA